MVDFRREMFDRKRPLLVSLWLIACVAAIACLPAFPENEGGFEALALLPAAAASDSSSTTSTDSGPTDATAPTFGGVTGATVDSTSTIDLVWTAATDETSASTAIVYEVCADTVATNCQTSFSATYTTSAGVSAFTPTGLNGFTTYYFVVRARDEAGNVDTNTIEMSATTSPIRMYQGATTMGSITRVAADASCTGSIPAGCALAAAMLSYSAADEVQDMPTNYGIPTTVSIRSTAGQQIAANWTSLLDGTIDVELDNGNVLGNNVSYWSGSDASGAVGNNCNGWTDDTVGATGNKGVANRTNSRWIHDTAGGSPVDCDTNQRFVCLCW